jgi:hypothetical protein
MKVYVCYEENNHDYAIECGAISDLAVYDTPEKALLWFAERVSEGLKDGFVLDSEDPAYINNNVYDMKKVAQDLQSSEFVSLTLFNGYQENWDESYAICIDVKEVK